MPFLSFYNPFAIPPSPVRMGRISHNKQQRVDQKRQEKWLVHRHSPSPSPFQRYLSSGLMRCWHPVMYNILPSAPRRQF